MSAKLLFCFARSTPFRRLGIAIAAMIPMIATTTNNSMSVKPLCLRCIVMSPLRRNESRRWRDTKQKKGGTQCVPPKNFDTGCTVLGLDPLREGDELTLLEDDVAVEVVEGTGQECRTDQAVLGIGLSCVARAAGARLMPDHHISDSSL